MILRDYQPDPFDCQCYDWQMLVPYLGLSLLLSFIFGCSCVVLVAMLIEHLRDWRTFDGI